MARSLITQLILTALIVWLATFFAYSWWLALIFVVAGLVGTWSPWRFSNAYLVLGCLGGIILLVLGGAGLQSPLIWPLYSLVVVLSLNQALILLLRHETTPLV